MRALVYGVRPPANVPADWEPVSIDTASAAQWLGVHFALPDWGSPARCVEWSDARQRARLVVVEWANGARAEFRRASPRYGGTWKIDLAHPALARAA